MDKLTHIEIAKRLGWSRQLLEYYVVKKFGKVPFDKAVAIETASNGQFRAKELCNGFKKTAKQVLKVL